MITPVWRQYPADVQRAYLHYKGYEQTLRFQVFHKVITPEAANAEIVRILRFYDLVEVRRAVNGGKKMFDAVKAAPEPEAEKHPLQYYHPYEDKP